MTLARDASTNLIFSSFWLGNGSVFEGFLCLMTEIFLAKWFPPVLNPSCFLPSSPLLMVLQAITSYRKWQFTSWGSSRAWPAERSSLTKFTLTRALNSQKAFALVPASRCRGYRGASWRDAARRKAALFTRCWVNGLWRWKTDGKRHFQLSYWSKLGFNELCCIAPCPCSWPEKKKKRKVVCKQKCILIADFALKKNIN